MYERTEVEMWIMAWVFLGVAIALEVVGTSLLKATEGFTRLWPTVGCIGAYVLAFTALSQAVKDVPVGLAYAMWAGLGTVAIVAIGILVFGEGITAAKIVGVLLVISGVLVLNLAGGAH